nr:hypothetical protein [Tanacetum cinerariifolium]
MRRASKGYTGVDIPLFLTMLVQGLNLQGEGSTVLVKSYYTPSGAPITSQPPLSSPFRIPTRQKTEVPHPSFPTHTNVPDEAASIAHHEGEKLEKIVKSTKSRRRVKIVVSDDEDAAEDTSKQGRKIDAIDKD